MIEPSCESKPGRTVRLICSLLPPTARGRNAVLAAAARLDRQAGADASGQLLQAFATWRLTGELPPSAMVRDLVIGLAEALGSVGPELQLRHVRAGGRP
ncbi:MAG: hypothetical protein JNM25_06940 [Planctomycetes bacterium]|nr:hypothetical protein [Planctomycetota bacterium]